MQHVVICAPKNSKLIQDEQNIFLKRKESTYRFEKIVKNLTLNTY